MENFAITLFEAITAYIRFFLFDVISILVVLGILILLVAGLTLGLMITIKTNGYITTGKVLGTVTKKRIKTKRSGEREEKSSTYLALEYLSTEGDAKVGLTSEWSNHYNNFKNHEPIAVRVISNTAYDDLYIANDWGALKLAAGFYLAGSLFFVNYWSSPAFWITTSMFIAIITTSVFLFLRHVEKPTAIPPEKEFTAKEIQPMPT